MAVNREQLDTLINLLLAQTVREFEEAAKEGKAMDPRRLVAAQRLIESADPRAFIPKVTDTATGEQVPEPPPRPKSSRPDIVLPPLPETTTEMRERFGSDLNG